MIAISEILKKYKLEDQEAEIQTNLADLVEKLNKIRTAYGKPMTITSGLRTKADQIRIYNQKGITDPKKIPMGSRHLYGQAADIGDAKKELQQWCKDNVKILEEAGLWCEHFDDTPTWVHFQTVPPKSGNRFFKP